MHSYTRYLNKRWHETLVYAINHNVLFVYIKLTLFIHIRLSYCSKDDEVKQSPSRILRWMGGRLRETTPLIVPYAIHTQYILLQNSRVVQDTCSNTQSSLDYLWNYSSFKMLYMVWRTIWQSIIYLNVFTSDLKGHIHKYISIVIRKIPKLTNY